MTELTKRNKFPFPSELEEPYYPSIKSFFLAVDAEAWANADNGNLTFNGGGLFSWNSSTSQLTWTSQVTINGFTTPFKAVIQGPPSPGGSLTINDGEVAFFTMPRVIQSNTVINLTLSTRIFQPDGTRLHDLRLFCARDGNTLLFPNGKSLLDGESAVLFGGGVGGAIPPHQHQPAVVYEGLPVGTTTLDLGVTLFGDEKLLIFAQVGIFSVGDTITGSLNSSTAVVTDVGTNFITISTIVGVDYQVGEIVTGNSTIVNVSVIAPLGAFSVGDGIVATGGATGIIRQVLGPPATPTGFLIKVVSGVFPNTGSVSDTSTSASATITGTVTIGNPSAQISSIFPPSNLLRVDLYRNGMLLAADDAVTIRDYSVNFTTGLITLHLASFGPDRFVALRETIPSGSGGNSAEHQHLKLPIPIVTNGVITLDMLLNSLTPSPNKLLDVNLYRNGMLQAQPGDYSLDAATGIVSLVVAANSGEIFIADRLVD